MAVLIISSGSGLQKKTKTMISVLFLITVCLAPGTLAKKGFMSQGQPDFYVLGNDLRAQDKEEEAATPRQSFKKYEEVPGASSFPDAGEGSGFLTQHRSYAQSVDLKTVNQELGNALRDALGHGHGLSPKEMEEKTGRVRPMFETMPKNMYGRVGRDAMEYMILRYFGAEHGWSLKGFDPASRANVSRRATGLGDEAGDSAATALRQKLPGYVEAVIEERLDEHGFALDDVVTFLVVLERLIFDESLEMLEDAYHLQEKKRDQLLSRKQLLVISVTYMLIYAFEADRRNISDFSTTMQKIRRGYPNGWPSGQYAIAETNSIIEEINRENPFAVTPEGSKRFAFDTAVRSVVRMNEGYGKWTNRAQCREMKEALVELDPETTGRVPLVDFYIRGNVSNNWFFEERIDYLRDSGAIDESSAMKGPRLIIANYVQSIANCVEVSGFYSVCCLRECESLLGAIEKEILEPTAPPSRILPVVQRLIDTTEETPRNLTGRLVSHLEVVAEKNGGQVPLHGRLFQQWLHYVFPYECPYPQRSSLLENGVTVGNYKNRTGMFPLLNNDEVQDYIDENMQYSRNSNQKKAVVAKDEDEMPKDSEVGATEEAPAASEGQNQTREEEESEEEARFSQWVMEEEHYVGYHHQGPRVAASRIISSSSLLSGLRSFLTKLVAVGVLCGGFFTLRPFLVNAHRQFSDKGENMKEKKAMTSFKTGWEITV